MLRVLLFVILGFALVLLSCEEKSTDIDEPPSPPIDTTTSISYYNGKLSHHQGDNCQTCHQKDGIGPAWFNVSGTVYDSTLTQEFPNATIKLYDGINATGNLISTIEVDSLGNFYTTEDIDFGIGLYVEVLGVQIHAGMGSLITSGACNKCHGVITNRIWVK